MADERNGNRPAGNSFTRSKSPWWIFSIVLNSCILVVSVKLIYWWAASVASWWTFVMQLMRGRPMAILLKTIFCLTSEKKTQCHVEANVHTDVRDCFFFPSSGIHKHTVHIGYQDGNNWEQERESFLSRFATYFHFLFMLRPCNERLNI